MVVARQPGGQAAGGDEPGLAETVKDNPATSGRGNDGCYDAVHAEVNGVLDPGPWELTIDKQARETAQRLATSGLLAHDRELQARHAALARSTADQAHIVKMGLQRLLKGASASVDSALRALTCPDLGGVAALRNVPSVCSGISAGLGSLPMQPESLHRAVMAPTFAAGALGIGDLRNGLALGGAETVREWIQRDRQIRAEHAAFRLLTAPPWSGDILGGAPRLPRLPRLELPPSFGEDIQELLRRSHRQARLWKLADAYADGDIDKVEAIREELGLSRAQVRGFIKRHLRRVVQEAHEEAAAQLECRDEALDMMHRGKTPDEIAHTTGVSREWIAERQRRLLEGSVGRLEARVESLLELSPKVSGEPASESNRPPWPKACEGRETGEDLLRPIDKLMALLFRHGEDWSLTQYAEAVGLKRPTLYDPPYKEFMMAWKSVKASSRSRPKGWKGDGVADAAVWD